MKLSVRLFIQKHENRTYTITVPALPGISAYGPTLEECKQEVAEGLAKRFVEMAPEALNYVALRPNQALERVAIELRPTDRHGRRRRDSFRLTVSLLLTPEEDGQILVSAPRLRYPPLSFFIATREELHAIAQLELAQYFHGESLEDLLAYQASRHETLDVLEVEFKPKRAADAVEEEQEESFWALRQSGVNLSAQAAEGQLRRAFRREKQVDELLAALAADRRPSLILVGPSGVGKTAIVHEAVRRIKRKECPETLHDRQVWSVTAATLLAGCSFIGQWQEKLNDLVREARKRRHILFIENIADLAEAGRWSKADDNMADFLRPFVQNGDITIIGESSPERLRRGEQLTPGFVAQFRTMEVAASSESDTLSILAAVARELERSQEVRIEPSALEAAVELSGRFLPYRAQPGKSVALLEQLAAEAGRREGSAATVRPALSRKELVALFVRQSGLPEFIIADNLPLDLEAVRRHFADRVIGQESAVEAMVDLIAMVKAGLNDPQKPLGSFLFIGPTGVGKTQLAKTLAHYLFGDERRLVRFDMSEYNDPAGVRRLLGAPGSGEEGELTGKVRTQPFCALLLDEFEKADPQIYDLFLQVLGEGRLSDASGRTTSFQNAIIIMTSNLGAGAREQRGIGLAADARRQSEEGEQAPPSTVHGPPSNYWQRKVEGYFRPEFVNRIDQIVAFQALGVPAMRQIARRELGDVLLREGLVRRNVLVEIDENVIDMLIEQGFNAAYGARPLKRAVERLIVLPLARFLASRDRPGADLLRLRREAGQIILSAASLAGSERAAEVLLDSGPGGSARRRHLDDRSLAEIFADLRRRLQDLTERDAIAEMHNERASRLAETNQPTFWDDGDAARETLARFYFLDRLLRRLQQLSDRAEYLEELAGLVYRQRDARYRAELAESYERLERDVSFLEVELLCAHLTHNHHAILTLRRVGTPIKGDEGEEWMTTLAAMYLRWAGRKGYDIACYLLEPLDEPMRAMMQQAGGERALVAQYFPYAWRTLPGDDVEELLKQLAGASGASALAISLNGANVYGFLKGEAGVHRRNDRRPGGERIQRLAAVAVTAPPEQSDAEEWLEAEVLARAEVEQSRAKEKKRNRQEEPEPEIIRVYQMEGERFVRDLRTSVKKTDVVAVLEGSLDDFILAYLRETESRAAWQED